MEDKSLELIAETVVQSCNQSEALRSIHVGLLCLQQSPEDRPSVSSVVVMLGSKGELPQPKQPGFFTEREPVEVNSTLGENTPRSCSVNELTQLEPR